MFVFISNGNASINRVSANFESEFGTISKCTLDTHKRHGKFRQNVAMSQKWGLTHTKVTLKVSVCCKTTVRVEQGRQSKFGRLQGKHR